MKKLRADKIQGMHANLISRNLKIKTYKTIMLSVVLHGVKLGISH
jgi:hypothetical protein